MIAQVELVQIDVVGVQPLQRRFAGLARMYSGDPLPPVICLVASSKVLPNFVAITTCFRRPARARASTRSLCPVPYTSEVVEEIDAQLQSAMDGADDSSSSTSPQPIGVWPDQNAHRSPSRPGRFAAVAGRYAIVMFA